MSCRAELRPSEGSLGRHGSGRFAESLIWQEDASWTVPSPRGSILLLILPGQALLAEPKHGAGST